MGIATSMPVQIETMKAAGNGEAHRFVIGPVTAMTRAGAAAQALGVSNTDFVTGDQVAVTTMGRAVVLSGAAIADNALVQSDATGRAVTHAAGPILGRARVVATGADQLIEVDLIKAVPPAA